LPQKGRGRAIKKAWQESKTDVVSYMDVDLSTQLEHFPSLINSLKNKSFDIAIGSRLLPKSVVEKRTLKREIISRCYNLLIRLIFFTKFSDAQCGFKATTRQVVDNLVPYILDNEWFFDSELLIVGEKAGYKIYEEPVHWIDNPGSTVKVMKTATGDLKGLWRLFIARPWRKVKRKMVK
jgi:glycosyltransferase involved in cell wall biosynthesis